MKPSPTLDDSVADIADGPGQAPEVSPQKKADQTQDQVAKAKVELQDSDNPKAENAKHDKERVDIAETGDVVPEANAKEPVVQAEDVAAENMPKSEAANVSDGSAVMKGPDGDSLEQVLKPETLVVSANDEVDDAVLESEQKQQVALQLDSDLEEKVAEEPAQDVTLPDAPEVAVEAPEQDETAAPEVTNIIEEPAKEMTKEPVEHISEVVQEPAEEVTETVEEPAQETTEIIEEPAQETAEIIEEPPTKEVANVVEEPDQDETAVVDEQVDDGVEVAAVRPEDVVMATVVPESEVVKKSEVVKAVAVEAVETINSKPSAMESDTVVRAKAVEDGTEGPGLHVAEGDGESNRALESPGVMSSPLNVERWASECDDEVVARPDAPDFDHSDNGEGHDSDISHMNEFVQKFAENIDLNAAAQKVLDEDNADEEALTNVGERMEKDAVPEKDASVDVEGGDDVTVESSSELNRTRPRAQSKRKGKKNGKKKRKGRAGRNHN